MKTFKYIFLKILKPVLWSVMAVLIFTIGTMAAQSDAKADLVVDFFDVGQGDAELLRSGGAVMLIDSGTPESGTAIRLFLKKQGVEKLDYLVLTHPDADHIGGTASVITNVPVGQVLMPDYTMDNEIYQGVINALNYRNLKARAPQPGETLKLGDCTVKVLGPINHYDDPNNNSIILKATCGNTSFMFVGDAEEPELHDVTLRYGRELDSDVYKVGHHGSYNSSSEEFLNMVSPEYAVISCADGNDYGHPHAESLRRLMNVGVHLFRTDKQGTITIRSDGETLSFETAPCDDFTPGEPVLNSQSVTNAAVAGTVPETTGDENYKYVKNTNTLRFHLPQCDSVKDMKEKNKEYSNQTREEIIAEGYKPCDRCRP